MSTVTIVRDTSTVSLEATATALASGIVDGLNAAENPATANPVMTDSAVDGSIATHASATDPHGDRAYADGLASNYDADGAAASAVSAHNSLAAAHPMQINAQTGTTYQLLLADAGLIVQCTNANPITLTVPVHTTVNFPVGTVIGLRQGGAGVLTIAAAGGVTINSLNGSLALIGQYANAALEKMATDTWMLMGALA